MFFLSTTFVCHNSLLQLIISKRVKANIYSHLSTNYMSVYKFYISSIISTFSQLLLSFYS